MLLHYAAAGRDSARVSCYRSRTGFVMSFFSAEFSRNSCARATMHGRRQSYSFMRSDGTTNNSYVYSDMRARSSSYS